MRVDNVLSEMCNLMSSVRLKAEDSDVDTEVVANVLKDTFGTEKKMNE